MSIAIERFVVGPLATNTYVVHDGKSGRGVVIDPAFFDERMVTFIRRRALTITHILLTHGHFDHVSGAAAVKKKFGAAIYLHAADTALCRPDTRGRAQQLGISFEAPPIEVMLKGGQRLAVGSLDFTVLHTPGHTPGSVCFYEKSHGVLFSGDTIFQGGYGRTDLPGGSTVQLFESIQKNIFSLPDETLLYPGHGETTSVGEASAYYRESEGVSSW